MKKIIKFKMKNGGTLLMEAEEVLQTGPQPISSRDSSRKTEDAGLLEKSLAKIKPAAEALMDTFKEINSPDEVNLGFALKFNMKAGAFIFSSGTETTLKVDLKWKNTKQ